MERKCGEVSGKLQKNMTVTQQLEQKAFGQRIAMTDTSTRGGELRHKMELLHGYREKLL